jgi:hypothetical protein
LQQSKETRCRSRDTQKITAKEAFASDVVGYTFVTVGSDCSSRNSGNRVAQLETLAVAPSYRGQGKSASGFLLPFAHGQTQQA